MRETVIIATPARRATSAILACLAEALVRRFTGRLSFVTFDRSLDCNDKR
jgi:hypothetical protein